MGKRNKGYWNPNTWDADVLEWQQRVIRNTEPLNYEEAIDAIGVLYRAVGKKMPNKGNIFLVENPLVATGLYFKLLGKAQLTSGIQNAWNRHMNQFRALEKLPKSQLTSIIPFLTVANLGQAWKDGVVDENYKVPHNGGGRSIYDDMEFGKEGDTYPDERSMDTRAMDFVVPQIVAERQVMSRGEYEVVGGRKVKVEGFGNIEPELQQELFMDRGMHQFIGNNFFHIFKNGYDDNPFVNMFIRLYEACSAWIGTEAYIILVDRPEKMYVEGPRAFRHNNIGPTVEWNGFNQYFLENQPVPPEWIEKGITYDEITNERNAEVRSMMLRHYGFDKYIENVDAELLDGGEDGFWYNGRPYWLYRTISPGGERMHLLKMYDASHKVFNEDTGQWEAKMYMESVSTQFNTCMECLADMAGVRPEQYKLAYET